MRGARGIDATTVMPVVEDALTAFGRDLGYAEAMLRSAANIQRKRRIWQTRLKVRRQEAAARSRCAQEAFICRSISPCGFGDCRFAPQAGPVSLAIVSVQGPARRVQPASYDHYDPDFVLASALAIAV